MQDAESEFKVAATATLTDAMSMESTYSFSIVIAPKGEYVPPVIEEPVANDTVEEEEEIVEEVITEDNSTKEEKTDEPAKSSSSSTAAAPAGPAFVFDPSAFEIPKRPPRQNQPITVMEYASPVEMFEKIEPTLRKVLINKEGTLGMDFSNDMVFPENWMAMHMDYLESTNQTDALEKARRRLVGEAQPFIRTFLKNAVTGVEVEIENDGMEIVTLDPNKLETKIKFKNPGTVSLSSQNEQDELIIKFDNSLIINDVDGNSLVFDNGEPTEDSVNFNIPVQPQVDKDSSEIQNLEGAAGTMETTGALLTFIQVFLTYMLNSSLGFFFGLINS